MNSTWKYKYFIDVVENKSFTKAGTINYVSQTAISQNISSLEKSIGGKLLNRGNGEIILTEIGEVVYKRAKEILSLEQQMLREVEHIKNKGMLLVGMDSAINKRMWMMVENVYETYFPNLPIVFTKVDCAMGALMLESRDLGCLCWISDRSAQADSGNREKRIVPSVGRYIRWEADDHSLWRDFSE